MATLHVCGELCRPHRGGPDRACHYGGATMPIVRAKTYGRPCDPFLRIDDTFVVVGDTLRIERTVIMRPLSVDKIDLTIGPNIVLEGSR